MPSYGEPMEELARVRIEEDGEPLVEVLGMCPGIRFAPEHPKFPGRPRTCWARKTVAEMLCRAESYLPKGAHLEILDAFRSDESQRVLFRLLCEELKVSHPEWTEAELLERTNDFVASPYAEVPPPHTTGGAVDITLVDDEGRRLDMTSPYEWDETSAPTSFPGISQKARRNRHVLIEAMSRAGFSNYLGEWWHWSYGDQGWALRAGLGSAMYGKVTEPPTGQGCPSHVGEWNG